MCSFNSSWEYRERKLNFSDTIDDFRRQAEELNKLITVKEDHLVINVHYEYNIPLARCRTHADILGWAFHLTEKTWITRELLRHFMRVAHSVNKLDVPSP